jgi:hypothetical protein
MAITRIQRKEITGDVYAALNGVTSGNYVIGAPCTLSADLTIAKGVSLEIIAGGNITVTGRALTINGAFVAPLTQVFLGAGTVTFGAGALDFARAEWWGLVYDGVTNGATAINYALASGACVELGSGVIYISSQLLVPQYSTLIGKGKYATWLLVGTTNAVKMLGLGGRVESLAIQKQNSTNTYTAIESLGITGGQEIHYLRFNDLQIDGFAIGIYLRHTFASHIHQCLINNCVTGVQLAGQSVNDTVTDSIIIGTSDPSSIGILGTAYDALTGEGLMVTDTITYGHGYGIKLDTHHLAFELSNSIIDGIVGSGSSLYLEQCIFSKIVGNWLCSTVNIPDEAAGAVNHQIVFSDNSIIWDTASNGMYIGADVNYVTVTHNNFYGENYGIRTGANAHQIVIADNTFIQTGGTGATIQTSGGGAAYIHDNVGTMTYSLGSIDDKLIVHDTFVAAGNENKTLVYGVDATIQRFETTLTAERTVTLSTTNATHGAHFRICRTAAGAFNLLVKEGGTTLASMPAPTGISFCDFIYASGGWKLTGSGSV